MTDIKLTKNEVFKWHKEKGIYAKGYLFTKTGELYRDRDLCMYFSNLIDINDFQQKLLTANGIFSIIIRVGDSCWAAVDRLRYFPLFYRIEGGHLTISDTIDELFDPDESKEMDDEAYVSFSGLGYVVGRKTLLKNIFQIQAGEYLLYNNQELFLDFYHEYFSEIKNISFEEAKDTLKKIIQNMGKRLSLLLGDRLALLPLSAGFDSRLIAYLLKKEGKNALCYTYGKKEGNPEWKRSKEVAEKLNFEWLFIDYSKIPNTNLYTEQKFIDFYTYTSQYISKFGVSQYFAANFLLDELKIPKNAVRFPGHGGDFLSGAYLYPYMKNYRSLSSIAKDIQYMRNKIISLNSKERNILTGLIKKGLVNRKPLFQNLDNWGLKENHSKYIVNTNKLWEQRGIENLMPLCDIEFMDFFIALPLEYKTGQNLYKTVVNELFEEFDIAFPHKTTTNNPFISHLKTYIKRLFPFIRKKTDIFMYDYFDLKRLSRPLVEELERAHIHRKFISYNGIFAEWYLLQIKKKIKENSKDNNHTASHEKFN